jgi:hypothetical protein
VAPLELERDREALLDAAKRLQVRVYIDSRARYRGQPYIVLFARDLMLNSFRRFDEALAWLQPVRPAEASE